MESNYLQKAKGPPGYCFWATIFTLSVLTLGNFFMTIALYKVMRLSNGMESLEVDQDHGMTSFYNDVTLDTVLKLDGKLESFSDESFQLIGEDAEVILKVPSSYESQSRTEPMVEVGLDSVTVKDFEQLDVTDEQGNTIFSTKLPQFGLPSGVQKLQISSATAKRVVSPKDSNLLIQSDGNVRLKGNEGIDLGGREISYVADQDLALHSLNGSLVFGGVHGIVLDIKKLQSSSRSAEDRSSMESYEDSVNIPRSVAASSLLSQYKLCICMPEGKLFRIPIPTGNGDTSGPGQIGCHSVDLTNVKNNPCL